MPRYRSTAGKPRVKLRSWRLLGVLGGVGAVSLLLLGVGWQNEVRTPVGMADEGLTTAISVAIVAVPVGLVRFCSDASFVD